MSPFSLFGDSDPSSPQSGETTGPLLLTNALNLNHFLSLGYVGPIEAFGPEDNYYGDFLDAAPGRLPLFTGPLSGDLIDHVRRESPRTARPVLLEFAPQALPQENVASLDAAANPVEGSATEPSFLATAPPLVVPFAAVRRVIFLSEEDRDEVLARSFENVPPIPSDLVAVAPDLAGNGTLSLKAALPWLGDLPKPQTMTRDEFREADRLAGAVALAVRHRPDLQNVLLTLLESNSLGSKLPSWFALLTAASLEEAPADPDALTFAASVSVLRTASLNEWRPQEVLERVWESVRKGGLPAEEEEKLHKGVERVRGVLNYEEEFPPSKSQRYPALQGLMLLLIREKPEPLLEWSPEETQAGELAHLTAALYAGLLHGHARLPLTLRDPETDRRIAEIVARRLSPAQQPSAKHIREPKRERPVERDLVSLLLEADLDTDGPYRRAAIDLCGYMDWKDCVRSYVVFPDADQKSPAAQYTSQSSKYNNRKLTTWSVPGVVELRHELDTGNFRHRLKAENIPERDLKRVQRMFETEDHI